VIVKCKTNKLATLPKRLQKFAFTQNEQGILDLTPGKFYTVFGVRRSRNETFYLTLTDSINTKLPWWMPGRLFSNPDTDPPQHWVRRRRRGWFHTDEILAPAPYHGHENDVEDGTPAGYEAFEKMKQAL